jgi:hypothetical protein
MHLFEGRVNAGTNKVFSQRKQQKGFKITSTMKRSLHGLCHEHGDGRSAPRIKKMTIFEIPERIEYMANFLQIISSVLVAFLLVIAADGQLCTAFLENRSETSSENHRDCSSDDFAVRVSATAKSEIDNQLRLSKRHPGNQVKSSVTSITSALNKSTMYKKSLSFARNNTLTTVLRI